MLKKLIFVGISCSLATASICMDDLSMTDVQQYFFADGNEKFQKIVTDDSKDWRPELYERFSDRLWTNGDQRYDLYKHPVKGNDNCRNLSANAMWYIDGNGTLNIKDGDFEKRVPNEKRRADQFMVYSAKAGRPFSFLARYAEPPKGYSFKSAPIVNGQRVEKKVEVEKKIWTFNPDLPFLATSLCMALKKKSSDGQKPVSIHQYPKAYETICSLPVKYRNKFVEYGWVELPATKRLTDWVKMNPLLTTSIGVGGTFLVAMKIKEALKKTNN